MRKLLSAGVFILVTATLGQAQVMTPELLWQLGRVSAIGLTDDAKEVIYQVTRYDIEANISSTETFVAPIGGGNPRLIVQYDDIFTDPSISPAGGHQLFSEAVKIKPVLGKDFHPDLAKSDVYIYDDLQYRHWDTWEDGTFNHLFIRDLSDTNKVAIDILEGQPYDTPLQPFGGTEDYTWNQDGSEVIYVTKQAVGKDYMTSTNTDVFSYNLARGTTQNLTAENKGYDTQPAASRDGKIAWLQMDEAGNEADKNDLIVQDGSTKKNLTQSWDGTVSSYQWSVDGRTIYFIAPMNGTIQLFSIAVSGGTNQGVQQITDGQFDVTSLVGEVDNMLLVTRTDMNHATEIFRVDLADGSMTQLTHVNDHLYDKIRLSKIEKEMVATTDGKEMVTWVIYPPDFDPEKKYPTLLYCQGGPQSPLSQFYSFRWNFQLMAAHGYIVVAPNRRGMPGHGVAWNDQISEDWGGQNMQDYLSAIDAISTRPYVDQNRLGCVGASYGGYSAFYLAGMHEGRFKSFIAHDGVFNTRSMFGTTEELFFVLNEMGGPYWEKPVQNGYTTFNPIEYVDRWDTPILIIQGGRDYRVPIGQGLEAFQAAQVRGLHSKLLYFPEENHWILSAQNAIIWQREFFKWLEETID